MEIVLLKVVAFLRPLFFIELGNENLFDVAGIGMFAVLAIVFLSNSAIRGTIRVSMIDFGIMAFVLWCVAVYLIYVEQASFRALTRLIIPPLTYVVAKNVIRTEKDYLSVMSMLLLGFVLPIIVSAALIIQGKGLESLNYWTGAPRYEGAYSGGHSLAHNMTFFLISLVVWADIIRIDKGERAVQIGKTKKVAVLVLALLGVYCLVMSRVRTGLLGLIVFGLVYLFFFNRRLLLIGVGAAAVGAVVFWPLILPFMFPDVVMVSEGHGDAGMLASGRPDIWAGKMSSFIALPLDMQIAGAGIGGKDVGKSSLGPLSSHNDYLDVLAQTGLVGLALFLLLQLLFLNAIRNIPGNQRYLFLAAWSAVTVMNFVSNSYVARFGLGQMYYLLLAYVELPRVHDAIARTEGRVRKRDA